MTLTWRDGAWLERRSAPALTGAEDGVFTTAGCEDGQVLLWHRHRARLERSLEALGPGRVPRLPEAEEVAELLRRCRVDRAGRLRVVARVHRGGWSIEAEATSFDAPGPWAEPLSLAVVHWSEAAPLAGHKSLMRAAWDHARERAEEAGCDDALLAAPGSGVLETSVANVFAVLGSMVVTPPAPDLCLPGVMRGWLLERLEGVGLTVEERPVTVEELEAADEVWASNALIGVRRVGRLGRRRWSGWPVRDRLVELGVPAPGWPRP